MKIIDISWPLSDATTGYKDRKILKFEERRSFDKDGYRETTIMIDSHSGTHVDAPAHMLNDGITIDQVSLDSLVGGCIVLDLTDVEEKITREVLAEHDHEIMENDIVILKTINSSTQATDKFTPHFAYLEISGAAYLAEKKIKAVGIDYLGIEHSQPGHLTHKELFKHDITIIEGLRLGHVAPGEYFFCCLPLSMPGLEAAPARAILIAGTFENEE
jgi:arylformamidase